jgi:hypothetical protein
VELLAKEAELVRAEALASQNAVAKRVGQKAVAKEAYVWPKKRQISPEKKRQVSSKKKAATKLKKPLVYPPASSGSTPGTLW